MKQLLVATDFSSCAGNAMEYALGLASVLEFEICVIHAIGTNEGVDNSIFNAIYIEEYYNRKREALLAWANNYRNRADFHHVPISIHCEVGGVSQVISKYIASNPVEMLVMGNIGSTGILGLFGSNVHTMMLKTKTPLLIVPLESKFSLNPAITLAIDFGTSLSTIEIDALTELLRVSGGNVLQVINVLEGTEWKVNEPGENRLRAILPGADLRFSYVLEDSAVEGILNYLSSSDTDILCVVKHHHNIIYRIFNKSTVNQVMHRSLKAILVLHE